MCPHLDKPVASWDFLFLGESDQVGVNQCVSLAYPQSLGFLEITTSEPIIHLAPIVSYCVLFSPFISLQVKLCHLASVHQRIHSHWVSLVISLQLWGWQELVGLERGQGGHCLFHLCSDLQSSSSPISKPHVPPETNIFQLSLQKIWLSASVLVPKFHSQALKMLAAQRIFSGLLRGSLSDLFHYLSKIVIPTLSFQDLFEF